MKKTASAAKKNTKGGTIDSAEVGQFDALAAQWWDVDGPFKPLHELNPVRMDYLKKQICRHFRRDDDAFAPLKGLSLVDIGCGGGLVTEPLCRLGAHVTGIDAGAKNIKAAALHAREHGLDIAYTATSAEALAATGKKFDVVTALEIVEHVADPALFITTCAKLVKKGGLVIFSTLNRTPKSYLLGIVAAEYILQWVPMGTHDWKKFLKPSEIARPLAAAKFEVSDVCGLVYNPFTRAFALSETDVGVNYFLTARKK